MKTSILLLSFCVTMLLADGQVKQSNKIIEKIVFDLNNDGRPDTILLSNPTFGNDPGIFQKVTVKLSGKVSEEFIAKDVWDEVDSEFLMKNHNAVNSKLVFVFKNSNYSLLLLFGFMYGSGRDEFTVIQIKEGIVKVIFDDQLEMPISLTDFGNDKGIELLGRNIGEVIDRDDSLNATIDTYNPFYVYSFNNGFQIDEKVTKEYNEEHYVWAGLRYSDGIKVLCPMNGGKPRIIK